MNKEIGNGGMMNRRDLIKSAGQVGLMGLLLSIGSRAGAHEGHGAGSTEEGLVIESGAGQLVTNEFAHHHHLLEVPLQVLQYPPDEGVTLHTGWAQFRNPLANIGKHYHSVKLSKEQLVAVAQGQTVEVEDTVKDHKFLIRWFE
jgi:hypothetical protein